MQLLRLNPAVGLDMPVPSQGVIVLDNVLINPEVLVDYAATQKFKKVTDTVYPGVRAPTNCGYLKVVKDFSPLIKATYKFSCSKVTNAISDFYMITTPLQELSLVQKLPHFDSPDSKYIALVHYLCDQGGTAFYRHRRSGIEDISLSKNIYARYLKEELEDSDDINRLFECTLKINAKFNRLAIFKSTMLHNAWLPTNFKSSNDPKQGRLTINTFFQYQ